MIKTERIVLRQFVPSDLENVFKGLSHPEVIKYYGVSYDSIESTQQQLNFFSDLEKSGTGIWWAVCAANSGEFYGACGFSSMSHEHKKAEFGLWLLPDYWGKGVMREAMPVVCNYGFTELDLHRIEAFVESENFNCKRVLLHQGFNLEGTMMECEIKNGKFINLEVYARLKK